MRLKCTARGLPSRYLCMHQMTRGRGCSPLAMPIPRRYWSRLVRASAIDLVQTTLPERRTAPKGAVRHCQPPHTRVNPHTDEHQSPRPTAPIPVPITSTDTTTTTLQSALSRHHTNTKTEVTQKPALPPPTGCHAQRTSAHAYTQHTNLHARGLTRTGQNVHSFAQG